MLKQHSPKHRTKRHRGPDSARPCSDGLAPLMRREDDRDDRERHRKDCRAADAHEATQGDEHRGGVREGARS